ncbi:type III-A CRISPR-associated protein Csm2 [uncultured Methanobrevibacter sp.]|uniref:type III-A CRISPR-associated protein Csm2 n=1 Tax=uncultured Methanobrevibacter sp. TaxID=253161 RepID=UPI0026DF3858|nr:type III-A CRISPR-associated protein Csm2 [uncultured Methanobrevibacter sp.]
MAYNNDSGEIKEIERQLNSYDMLKDIDMKKLIDEKDGFAYIIADNSKNLKTNQLRKFFGAIRKMEGKEKWELIEPDFYLLKPRIAVGVARGHVPRPFYNVIMTTMRKVDVGSDEEKIENFKIFVEFFEAIVAYHKFRHEKKNNRSY